MRMRVRETFSDAQDKQCEAHLPHHLQDKFVTQQRRRLCGKIVQPLCNDEIGLAQLCQNTLHCFCGNDLQCNERCVGRSMIRSNDFNGMQYS